VSARRVLAAAAAVMAGLALVTGLTACRKPAPRISVYSDGTTIQVPAFFYAQSGGPRRAYLDDFSDAPTLRVRAGSAVHIDVPRQVATSWVVVPLTLDSSGTATALPGVAPQEVMRNRHAATLSTTSVGYDEFYVQVAQLRGSEQAGGWVFHVVLTS
jgi:hypothetical protein